MDGLVPNSVCLDASNCNQVNAFSHSSRKIPSCFCFSLYHFWRAFHSVVNCTCSLLFFTILHFLFTTVVQPPFSAKAFQGSLHLMCIINRLNKRATSKRKKNAEIMQMFGQPLNQSKSLHGFLVVMPLHGNNSWSIQTLVREWKRPEVIFWNSCYGFK